MTEEDLVIGDEVTEDVEVEAEFYEYDDAQIISAACTALDSVEAINAMTAADQKRINRVKKKCLRLIEYHIGELYDLTFTKEDDEADN